MLVEDVDSVEAYDAMRCAGILIHEIALILTLAHPFPPRQVLFTRDFMLRVHVDSHARSISPAEHELEFVVMDRAESSCWLHKYTFRQNVPECSRGVTERVYTLIHR